MIRDRDIAEQLLKELTLRSTSGGRDVHDLERDLQASADAGGHILLSRKPGEASILVPFDGFEPPSRLRISDKENKGKILAEVDRGAMTKIGGLTFAEFVVSNPGKLLGQVQSRDRHPQIGLQGKGGDGWTPLGFEDGFFWEDLALLVDVEQRGGFVLRPDPEIGEGTTEWRRLSKEERDAVENALGHVVPEIVHRSTLEKAKGAIPDRTAVIEGALTGIKTATHGPSAAPDSADRVREEATAAIKPLMQRLIGAQFDDPDYVPNELLELAASVLKDDAAAVRVLKGAAAEKDVDPAEVIAALDRAFGSDFTSTRKVSLELVDAVLDYRSNALAIDEANMLRSVRVDLRYADDLANFGELATRPTSLKTADTKLRELHRYLHKGTGLDESQVFALAMQVQAAANVKSARPQVIIIAGDAPQANQVFKRIQKTLAPEGAKVSAIHADSELRGRDPVGRMLGSPHDSPGVARGLWAPEEGQEKFLSFITGVEGVAGNVTDETEKETAQRAFWSLIAQAKRDGKVRVYDPGADRSQGGSRDLGGGTIVIRTEQSRDQLKEAMPFELWTKLQASVIDFGHPTREAALESIRGEVSRFAEETLGIPEAQVELGEAMKQFLQDLLSAGMDPKALHELTVDRINLMLTMISFDQTLGARIRLDLGDLTTKQVKELMQAWSRGELEGVAGVGLSPFQVSRESFIADPSQAPKAEMMRKAADYWSELEQLRLVNAQLQKSTSTDQHTIGDLIEERTLLQTNLKGAENHHGHLRFKYEQASNEIQELRRLGELQQQTIKDLNGRIEEANKRIKQLNTAVEKGKKAGEELKEMAETAKKERDRLAGEVRRIEAEFNGAIQALAQRNGANSAIGMFDLIAREARGADRVSPYLGAYYKQLLQLGGRSAISEAGSMGRGNFDHIAQIAKGYAQAAQTVGATPEMKVLAALEAYARLSGGSDARMVARWKTITGLESQLPESQDPGALRTAIHRIIHLFG